MVGAQNTNKKLLFKKENVKTKINLKNLQSFRTNSRGRNKWREKSKREVNSVGILKLLLSGLRTASV